VRAWAASLPVVDDLRFQLNLDDLATLERKATRWSEEIYVQKGVPTYEMVDVGSDNETFPSTGDAIVNSNNVTWL
jgi:hypothetical protein